MIAQPQYAPDRFERSITAITDLLDELKISRHALFHEVGEGTIFPDGTESMSGGVVDEHGQVFTFWTDWDAARGRPVFTTWKQIEPGPKLMADSEYREAREAVGLSNVSLGLLRPPGQRYAHWKDQDGVDRFIPEHTLKQVGEAAAFIILALAHVLENIGSALKSRR